MIKALRESHKVFPLYKVFSHVERGFGIFAGGIIMVMMVLVTANAVGRAAVSTPIQGTLMLVEMMMVAIVFLAFAWVQRAKAFIRIQTVFDKLPKRVRPAIDLLSQLIGLIVFGLVGWQATGAAVESYRIGSITSDWPNLPLWPSQAVLSFGCLLLIIRLVIDSIALVRGRPNGA